MIDKDPIPDDWEWCEDCRAYKPPGHNKNKDKDWNSKSGRWQALALTVQSHRVKNRLLSTGYDRFKKDPVRFKEMYRNTLVE